MKGELESKKGRKRGGGGGGRRWDKNVLEYCRNYEQM